MNRIFILIVFTSFWACQQTDGVPGDLAGKKEILKDKKLALKVLQQEISALEKEILELDPPKEKTPILVNIDTLQPQLFERFVTVQAAVESDEVVNVTSEMAGRLKNIKVKEGQYVKKGQLIATINMETLEKQIVEMETSLSLAREVFERQKRLWDQQIGSEIQYLQAKNNKERLEKGLETLQSQLSKQYVYAPISGIVDQEYLSSGEVLSPGMPIVNILETSTVKIVADVPESYLGDLRVKDYVEIYIPALDRTMREKIDLLGRTIDPSNRTFKIEIMVSNPGGTLKPNLLAEVKFNDYQKENALVASIDYILEEVSGKKFVFLGKQENNKYVAKKSYVTLGESYEGKIVIEDGLQPGDLMITEGARNVTTNDPIKIANLL